MTPVEKKLLGIMNNEEQDQMKAFLENHGIKVKGLAKGTIFRMHNELKEYV